jgi:peptidoglycan/LPS O-acetylase OafA/YrhL
MMLVLPLLYLIAQIYAAVRMPGGWRWAALIPVVPMLLIFGVTINALIQNSNIWPVLLILACPPALVFLVGVLVVHRFVGMRAWAKWAFVVITILLGVQLVFYTSSMIAEQRSHGETPTLFSLAPVSAVWSIPLLVMLVCTIALWRSEQQRQRQPTTPSPAPA